ncbi:hypothetical protein SAMN05216511_7144 [Streptomyces sp. KS_16]|nr:hypothetical protein SAMN05216511_7144 [Streptomyces sp. KS_16]SNC59560.1 hypothetical protein SAMN06272741_0083 [Streptomyces sp. 2114.4]
MFSGSGGLSARGIDAHLTHQGGSLRPAAPRRHHGHARPGLRSREQDHEERRRGPWTSSPASGPCSPWTCRRQSSSRPPLSPGRRSRPSTTPRPAVLRRSGNPVPPHFFVCDEDLEDELIRALGVARVTELIQQQGDLRPLRIFLSQPAQRGRSPHQQLRRFLGTKKGRKVHYGRVLVDALPHEHVPTPLADLLDFI